MNKINIKINKKSYSAYSGKTFLFYTISKNEFFKLLKSKIKKKKSDINTKKSNSNQKEKI